MLCLGRVELLLCCCALLRCCVVALLRCCVVALLRFVVAYCGALVYSVLSAMCVVWCVYDRVRGEREVSCSRFWGTQINNACGDDFFPPPRENNGDEFSRAEKLQVGEIDILSPTSQD